MNTEVLKAWSQARAKFGLCGSMEGYKQSLIAGMGHDKQYKERMEGALSLYDIYIEENNMSMNIASSIEKYVVMTTGGNFQGSWEKEKDAIMAVRRMIKNNGTREIRYLVLEAKKEIGTKSPEIEIEDIK